MPVSNSVDLLRIRMIIKLMCQGAYQLELGTAQTKELVLQVNNRICFKQKTIKL